MSSKTARSVVGAVMVEFAEFIVFGDNIEFVFFQFGIDVARERQRVEIGIRGRDSLRRRDHTQKSGV